MSKTVIDKGTDQIIQENLKFKEISDLGPELAKLKKEIPNDKKILSSLIKTFSSREIKQIDES